MTDLPQAPPPAGSQPPAQPRGREDGPLAGRAAPLRRSSGGGRSPVWVQALLIVGIGCGACLALFLVGVGAAAWWVLRPGRQVPTEAIVGPRSVGQLRLSALADDPGVTGALERLAAELAAVQEERSLQRRPEQRGGWGDPGGPPTFLATAWFPRDATLLIDRVADDDELHVVFAANFRWLVRPARLFSRLIAAGEELAVERHAGQRLIRAKDGDGPCVCFVDSTLLVGDDVELVKVAIDRLAAQGRSADPDRHAVLPPGLPQPQEGWDLTGVMHGGPDDLREILGWLGPAGRTRWPERYVRGELEQATLGIDWETVDRVRARFTIDTADDLAVEDWADALEAELSELARRLEPDGLILTHELDLDDGRIAVELTLDGLERLLERVARNF